MGDGVSQTQTERIHMLHQEVKRLMDDNVKMARLMAAICDAYGSDADVPHLHKSIDEARAYLGLPNFRN